LAETLVHNLEPETVEKWRKAGRISALALRHGAKMLEPGARVRDVADSIEDKIRELGGEPAFPACLSINEVAAHYAPPPGDDSRLQEGDIVKLDCGAHVDGYIGDNAVTVDVGNSGRYDKLIEAARAALTVGVSIMGPNVNLSTVGAAIEETVREYGYRTISNLTGHSIERWNLHAGLSVPAIANTPVQRPRVGTVLACEPFVTDGAGHVINGPNGNIYHYMRNRPVRQPDARKLLAYAARNHPKLPFASRWVDDVVSPHRLNMALQMLTKHVALKNYAALVEAGRGMVAQFEHTMMITEDGVEVLTLLDGDDE
jgi:methionyl aminopeptidase